MKNPLYNRKHILEYILYGFLSATVYIIPVVCFLSAKKYVDFYYLYIGNALFAGVITWHAWQLLYRVYDGKRAVTMLIAGNLTVVTGIILSCLFIWVSSFVFSPHLFAVTATENVIAGSPSTIQPNIPAELSFMLTLNAVVVNFCIGAFVTVIMSYAGKVNQAKDQPANLDEKTPPVNNAN